MRTHRVTAETRALGSTHDQPAARRRLPAAFHALYVGETISLFGMQVTAVALPLVAALSLGVGAFTVGLINAMSWLPIIAFGVLIGALVDRNRKWPILLCSNVVRAGALATIPILYWTGWLSVPALLAVAFITGTASVAFDITYQSYVPELVPTSVLDRANSLAELSRSAAQLAGPLAGGALVSLLKPPYAITVTVLTYLIAVLALLTPSARRASARAQPVNPVSPRHLLRDIREGQSVVWFTPSLRIVVAAGGSINIFVSGMGTLLVLFIVRELALSASYVGVALAAAGGGAVLGSALFTSFSRRVGETGCVAIGLSLMGVGALALPCAGLIAPLPVLMIAEFLFGFGTPVMNIALVTMRQKIAPRALLGRVNATARVLIMSTLPAGALIFGAIGQMVGIWTTLWIIGTGMLVVCVIFAPLILRIRLTEADS